MRSSVRWLAVVTGLGYAALASRTQPLTGTASVAVAVPAVIVLTQTIRPSGGRRRVTGTEAAAGAEAGRLRTPGTFSGPARRTAAAWGVVVVSAAALELVAFLRQPAYDVASPAFPTLSLLLDPVTGAGATRFLVWCCWLWAGWALVRR